MEFSVENSIEVLRTTPAILRTMLAELSGEWTSGASDSTEWSAFDVVGHLIHGEQTDWIPRARIILEQGENLTFVPFDRFAQFETRKGSR